MNHDGRAPLLYEINTRCWLRELSGAAGESINLSRVPEAMVKDWVRLGFTHIWLMGVWTTGLRSRAAYLHHPDTRGRLAELLPDWSEADVPGSPYAIASYRVPETLGGEAGLAAFRAQLRRHGLRLVLDFVPNHTGLDHPWLEERPGWFVPGRAGSRESFLRETREGPRWLAHGKDPHFPAWNDTAQLDFRHVATRSAMVTELRSVAARCDGVRCDMAMLVLNDIFSTTWKEHPPTRDETGEEFWAEAIRAVRMEHGTEFQFIAEVYWDLEARLQALGFDFTCDKRVLDRLVSREPRALAEHLSKQSAGFLSRSIHFLENHDEARIASRLSFEEHRAAALLTLALPGMPLLHEGQLTGATRHTPAQLARRPLEPPSREIKAMYASGLAARRESLIGRGVPAIHAREDGVFLIQWTGEGRAELAAINLGAQAQRVESSFPGGAGVGKCLDRLGNAGDFHTWKACHPLTLDLAPHAAHWYQWLPGS